ncbi:hypothetical protein Mycch_2668 [Mycolicibacterium chubuense NBB4]|uniref:Uncharacterized protein n=1 Tax=Mycolicibacterium chubuense (strain NBB4) TaxID=710421 RepID=I4BJH8_MYCCN|nr:hypothetical protein [Mycolicibacterium chubuense]AFM17435.1 hypothetical protein Mycch_2668 [Mycolicibacterium chubuense NBB4]
MKLELVATDGWSKRADAKLMRLWDQHVPTGATIPTLTVVQHIADTMGRDRFAVYDRIRYLKQAGVYHPQPLVRPVS